METDKDLSLSLDPTLRQTAQRHVAAAPVRLVALEAREIITSTGNFGIPVTYHQRLAIGYKQDGLLELMSIGAKTAAELDTAPSGTRTSSLCGLVTLTAETVVTPQATSTVVPIGKIFVPISSGGTYTVVTRSRLDALDTAYGQLCNPKPGDSFTFKTAGQFQRDFRGTLIKSNRLLDTTTEVTCAVSPQAKSAGTLSASLRGDYLLVECKHKASNGMPEESSHAFLRESGIYLLLSMKLNSVQSNRIELGAAKYE